MRACPRHHFPSELCDASNHTVGSPGVGDLVRGWGKCSLVSTVRSSSKLTWAAWTARVRATQQFQGDSRRALNIPNRPELYYPASTLH